MLPLGLRGSSNASPNLPPSRKKSIISERTRSSAVPNKGLTKAAELLVKHEADRGLKNADGHTAYEIAKMNNQDAIMKVLE